MKMKQVQAGRRTIARAENRFCMEKSGYLRYTGFQMADEQTGENG